MQRVRLTFSRGPAVKYISHLDLMRLWERALRRAAIPVAQTAGFNPHPRLALACPLAVGVTGEAELLDLYLDEEIAPAELRVRLEPQLPRGIELRELAPVPVTEPAAQARLRSAEYVVVAETDWPAEAVEAAIGGLLAAASIPRERAREGKVRAYDLRPLVEELRLRAWSPGWCHLEMRLRAEGGATGRPEEVAKALGLDRLVAVHRTRLILG